MVIQDNGAIVCISLCLGMMQSRAVMVIQGDGEHRPYPRVSITGQRVRVGAMLAIALGLRHPLVDVGHRLLGVDHRTGSGVTWLEVIVSWMLAVALNRVITLWSNLS